MLVDSRGNPLTSDGPIGPMYGPVRFEDQPAKIRRLGRKQLAGRTKAQRVRKKAWWAKNAGREYDVPRWATKSAEKRRSRRSAGGRRRRSRSAWSYDQPTWATRGRRKSKRRSGRSSYRTASRRTRRYSGGRRTTRGLSRKEIRRQNRATWRARKSTRRGRKASRSSSRRSSRGASARRTSGGRRTTYGQIMSRLRGTRSKAWVCAGPRRTGCGGGRKGRRGSRVIGILRG